MPLKFLSNVTLQLRGWAGKFTGWLMQWSNLTQCGLCFSIVSRAVHTLLPSVLQAHGFLWYTSSHPDPRESPQLQIWPHHRSDTASQPSFFVFFFHVGEQKITRVCQTVQSHGHAQQPLPLHTLACLHVSRKHIFCGFGLMKLSFTSL